MFATQSSINPFFMNPFFILGAGTAIVLAASYLSTGSKLLSLTGYPSNISYVKKAGFFNNLLSQSFKLDFAIENPNRRAMTFQRFNAKVFYNGKYVAKIDVQKNISLPAQDTTILQGILINISTVDVGTALFKKIFDNNEQKTNEKQNFQVVGVIKADGFIYPVDEKIDL